MTEICWQSQFEPYWQDEQTKVYCCDCMDFMATQPSQSVDWVIADPPYGVNKEGAAWDTKFADFWFDEASRICRLGVIVIPGTVNIARMPQRMAEKELYTILEGSSGLGAYTYERTEHTLDYRWMLSIHINNGMTRSPLGFSNWIGALVYTRPEVKLHFDMQDSTVISIGSEKKLAHPSQKPLPAMSWIISRLPGNSVFDPFGGTGSTVRAARQHGWTGVTCDTEKEYCDIIKEQCSQLSLL